MEPISTAPTERPPYRLAGLAALIVLGGYALSLAPSVTFWDAGEFITASHTLGIPHPPGTPVFVLLGRTFDALVPGLSTAVITNLMSATFSAAAAGLLFLLAWQALAAGTDAMDAPAARVFRVGGAFAATLIAAFTFTTWQNSNETEVYQVAMFSIALLLWCCWLWRRARGTRRGAHLLLLMVYLFGLSLGNHLMALLAGPAVLVFLAHVLRHEPAAGRERAVQWVQAAVAAAIWVAMVGVGTGNAALAAAGGLLVLAAAAWALRAGAGLFALAAVLAALAGLSTYAVLYVRAGLRPDINMADPSSLQALWDVISRRQYPARSPLDDPAFPTGPGNPGRTLSLFALQLANYVQYFDWQWSNGLATLRPVFAPVRLPFTLLFAALGLFGAARLRRWDRAMFRMLGVLFLTTGLGLVLYLDFKPGFSIGLPAFPAAAAREVRERDYFFTVSFVVWGLWAGLGLAALLAEVRRRRPAVRPQLAALILLVALVPAALNWRAADRAHGPTAALARDFAWDLLQSVEPYGILVTGGDNDQYPLWYLQHVEGVRRDVAIVNASLVNTDWYLRQLRDSVQRRYRPDAALAGLYAAGEPPAACPPELAAALRRGAAAAGRRLNEEDGPPACLHTLSDEAIAALTVGLRELPRDFEFRAAGIRHVYPAGTVLTPGQVAILKIIQENLGRRPIHVAATGGSEALLGLEAYAVRQGLAWKLSPGPVAPSGDLARVGDTLLDVERTRALAWRVYRYAGLFDGPPREADPTDQVVTFAMSQVWLALAQAAQDRGDRAELVSSLRRGYHLFPDPTLAAALRQLERGS